MKFTQYRIRTLQAAVAAAFAIASGASQALTFDLSFTSGTTADEKASFQAAANLWSALLFDPVTVKLTVGTAALGANILGQAGSRYLDYSYSDVRTAMTADKTSALDMKAVASLSPATSVNMLINLTKDNPNGAGSPTPFLDNNGSANNSIVSMTAANARALNLPFAAGGLVNTCANCDGFIEFSNNFNWDHDRSNGISVNTFDFIGVAAHEIGHVLGFVSGVDVLDYNGGAIYNSNGVHLCLAAGSLPLLGGQHDSGRDRLDGGHAGEVLLGRQGPDRAIPAVLDRGDVW